MHRPIEEYVARWERAQASMQRLGLGLLLISPGPDFVYLLGRPGHLSERLTLLALPPTGRPVLVIGGLEAPPYAPWAESMTIQTWRDEEDPVRLLRRAFSPVSVRAAAVSDQLWSVHLLRLQEAYQGASWVPASRVTRGLRIIKDEGELAIMREAARRTDEVWEIFREEPVAGLTERQAADRLTALLAERGMPPSFSTIVAAGPHAASPHHEPGERVIQVGDALVCDFGGILDGYCSDITRTAHVGPPSDRFQAVYAVVRRAQETAFRQIRPGRRCEEIDEAARWVIEASGFGANFIHRTGHGLGIDIHEEPYMVKGNREELRAGMVFSDEPGIYLPGEFGVRIEDIVVVEGGAERLTGVSRDITVMR
jgi:Xaa-Pro aminopeptidase